MSEATQSNLGQWDPRLQKPPLPAQKGILTEERLLPQIATPPKKLAAQEYEEMILSKIGPLDTLIGTIVEVWPDWRGGRKWRKAAGVMRLLKRSEAGWQQTMIVKATGAATGQPRMSDMAQKPGMFARNLWDRSWKEKATQEGKELPPGESQQ